MVLIQIGNSGLFERATKKGITKCVLFIFKVVQ